MSKYQIVYVEKDWADLEKRTDDYKEAQKLVKGYTAFRKKLGYTGKVEAIQAENIAAAREIVRNRGKTDYEVTGTSYEDKQLMQNYGLRWDRKRENWRGKLSPPQTSELKKKRFGVKKSTPFTESERKKQLKEKQLSKPTKYREWGEKRKVKAKQSYERATSISDMIPLGQPILVGHHSEKHHRSDIAKIERGMDKAVEHTKKAETFLARASSLERAASTIKGDAERERQRKREKLDKVIEVGSRVNNVHYGIGTVMRVNKKTYTVQFDGGFKETVDKTFNVPLSKPPKTVNQKVKTKVTTKTQTKRKAKKKQASIFNGFI